MPVVVKSSFLLVAAVIGFAGGFGNISRTVAWILIVFVSILIHELGHAFAARRYSADVAIEVNGFGGLTRWSVDADQLTPGRRAFIAAAGSAVGVVVGGLVWLIAGAFGPYDPYAAFVLDTIILVNLFWGLLNWLPIRPLDGGHLFESLLEKLVPKAAPTIATVVFTVTAAIALGIAIWQGFLFITVLAAWLLLSEFTRTRPTRSVSQPARGLPELSYDTEPEQQIDDPSN